jgi:hypothetical protein
MVRSSRHVADRLSRATVLIVSVLGLCACGSSADAAGAPAAQVSSAPASAAPSVDVAQLAIQAGDIPLPGFSQQSLQPVTEGPVTGLAAVFGTADGTRLLGETIVLLPDAEAARTAVQGAVSTTESQRPGSTTATVPVGDLGMIITGYRVDGTESTMLLLSQGVASVVMDFRSPETDPIPADVVTAVGVKQAALLKAKLG